MDHLNNGDRLRIQFWGVRGSTPAAEAAMTGVGGNTPCIALNYGLEPVVIIDGGTGLRLLGLNLNSSDAGLFEASILFSHFHWDHIQGLPFFPPIYSEHARLNLYSGVSAAALEQILQNQMRDPYFPIPFSTARSRRHFSQVTAKGCQIGSLRISPVHLNHPGGATGYRIDSPAGSLIYVSDHEHGVSAVDDRIAEDAAGADLLIYDSQFTPTEYPNFKGWGHSTWLEGTRLAIRAGIKQLLLFHHSPSRTDKDVAEVVAQARQEFPATNAACENRVIFLPN